MNDKRIEDLLRQSWKPATPDGMRDRVLRNARQSANRRSRSFIFGWKPALVGLALLCVLIMNISEHARSVRVATLLGNNAKTTTQQLCRKDIIANRREMAALCESAGCKDWMLGYKIGDGNGKAN